LRSEVSVPLAFDAGSLATRARAHRHRSFSMRLFPRHRWITFAVALAACHDGPTGPAARSALSFSGVAGATDTIGASLTEALVVEVHDSTGAIAAAGTVVLLDAVPAPEFRGSEVLVEPLTSATSYGEFGSSLTDGTGTARVHVKLGTIAGTARLLVTVPALGLQDTVRFTVTPGNAAGARVLPADTTVYPGTSFTLRGTIVDRKGNPRPDPVIWSDSGSGITVTGAGVVTATAIGRYRVKVGSVPTDSGWVSVVPRGRLAAAGFWPDAKLVSLDVDGSHQITLATLTDGGVGIHPVWIPGTNTIVYATVVDGTRTLYTVDADGGVPRPFFATRPATMTAQAEPTPSADGKWLFFVAFDTRCSARDYCVWRARIDGSSPELLVATPSQYVAPSPDGSKVAYVGGGAIKVLDIATGTTSTWSVTGTALAWSPDGSQIAYVSPSSTATVAAPDGSGARALLAVNPGMISSWSPDGKWLVMQRAGSTLVDAATGAALPLSYTTLGSTTGKLVAMALK
jgi:hypothetical protein